MNECVNDFSPTVKNYHGELHKYDKLDREVEDKLIALAKNGDVDARNKVIEAHLKFVFHIASKYKGCGVDMCELISDGNYGLINAINRFDNTRGVKFITYAMFCIKEKILEKIKSKTAISKVEVDYLELENKVESNTLFDNEDDNVSLGETMYIDNDEHGDDKSEMMNKEYISMLMESLNPKEKFVIKNYFGIDCEEKKLFDIGKELGVTKERARQIKVYAMRKLRSEALAMMPCIV